MWESPVRIIVEETTCWQCPNCPAFRAWARFCRCRAVTPYPNPAPDVCTAIHTIPWRAQRSDPERSLNQWLIAFLPNVGSPCPEGHVASYAAFLLMLFLSDSLSRSPVSMDAGMHLKPEIPPRHRPVPPESPLPHELNSLYDKGRHSMTPDLQDTPEQHAATGWIAHPHPVQDQGGMPCSFPASVPRFRTARTRGLADRHRYS